MAIRDKYLDEIWDYLFVYTGDDSRYRGQTMLIKNHELEERVVAKSEEPYIDKFSRKEHYLLYYDWLPDDNKQDNLL